MHGGAHPGPVPIRGRAKRWLENVFWRLYGPRLNRPSLPREPGSLLFLCRGNLCRSPFAQHLAENLLRERNVTKVKCFSAGLEVDTPGSPPEQARVAALSFGVSLDGHKARPLEVEMLGSHSVIIVMEGRHLRTMRRRFPHSKEKFFLLPLFENPCTRPREPFLRYNIQDPYGGDTEEFLACYRRIERSIAGMLNELFAGEQEGGPKR